MLKKKNWRGSILAALLVSILPALCMAQVGVSLSVNLAPPELPVYDQPAIPGDGYIWTPGYWYWDNDQQDYYWVPGTWVLAPQPGFLWTPGYWGSDGGEFVWHVGYWGEHVGFYGGVDYGHGYGGNGFEGGYWQGGHLYYNRSVVNIGTTNITNVYNKTVVNNITVNRVSYNGGSGGVQARPTAAEESYAHERHLEPVAAQRQQVQAARSNPALSAKANHGNPPVAATARPGEFKGAGVVAARHAAPTSVVHQGAPAERPKEPSRTETPRPTHAPVAPREAAPATEERRAPAPAERRAPATEERRAPAPAERRAPAPEERRAPAPAERRPPAPEERRAAEPVHPSAPPKEAPKQPARAPEHPEHPPEHDHDRS